MDGDRCRDERRTTTRADAAADETAHRHPDRKARLPVVMESHVVGTVGG